jgi:hypothetical protein
MSGLVSPKVAAVWLTLILGAETTMIVVAGVESGRWGWGLAFAVGAIAALIDWWRVRSRSDEARAVADRMVGFTAFAFLGVAMALWREAGV